MDHKEKKISSMFPTSLDNFPPECLMVFQNKYAYILDDIIQIPKWIGDIIDSYLFSAINITALQILGTKTFSQVACKAARDGKQAEIGFVDIDCSLLMKKLEIFEGYDNDTEPSILYNKELTIINEFVSKQPIATPDIVDRSHFTVNGVSADVSQATKTFMLKDFLGLMFGLRRHKQKRITFVVESDGALSFDVDIK